MLSDIYTVKGENEQEEIFVYLMTVYKYRRVIREQIPVMLKIGYQVMFGIVIM